MPQRSGVRRVEIPNPGSKEKRPLGIPTIEDKVLQKGVQMVLEPIHELEFYPFSFGFRKGKSAHQALEYLWQEIMGKNIQWIIDLDIRKFFDTVKHDITKRALLQEGALWSDRTTNRQMVKGRRT